jgi:hypothetical protein
MTLTMASLKTAKHTNIISASMKWKEKGIYSCVANKEAIEAQSTKRIPTGNQPIQKTSGPYP